MENAAGAAAGTRTADAGERHTFREGSDLRIGAHLSISAGWPSVAGEAERLGCQALQVFSRSPRGNAAKPIDTNAAAEMRHILDGAGIGPVVVHMPYFVNLAAGEDRIQAYSVEVLALDLERADQLGSPYVVTHAGQAKGDAGEARAQATRAMVAAFARTTAPTKLLLETTAGGEVGGRFEDLAALLAALDAEGLGERMGVCFDTCHVFASGYDLSTPEKLERVLDEFDRVVGLHRIKAMHLNDAAKPLGSGTDRHANIGQGLISTHTFRALLQNPMFRDVPGILETPDKDPDARRRDLATLKALQEEPQSLKEPRTAAHT